MVVEKLARIVRKAHFLAAIYKTQYPRLEGFSDGEETYPVLCACLCLVLEIECVSVRMY